MKLNDRIAQARMARDLSQAQLASILGVSRGACGQWEQGVSTPNTQNLIRLATVLEVRFEWLTTGRGGMELTNEVREKSAEYGGLAEPMSGDLRAVVAWIQRQPKDRQRAIIRLLKNLAEITGDES